MNNLLSISRHWAIAPDVLNSFYSLSTQDARPLPNTRTVKIRNGVAIIPITGVITGRTDFWTLFLGGTSLDMLAKEFRTAITDDDVKAIILNFDSPGGVAVGPAEMAEIIFNAKGTKPIVSYVGRNCCSAAYWLASAADKIVAHSSAVLGSIGVVSAIPVQEAPDSDGCKTIRIVSSNAMSKCPDPRTEDGIKQIRQELDALENQFINSISKYRDIAPEIIKKDFGNGGVFVGQDAISRKMADEIGDFESLMTSLSQTQTQMKGVKTKMENEQKLDAKAPEITADFLKTEHSAVAQALIDEGFTKGKAAGIYAERERILAIEKISMPGHENLIARAKADETMTAESVAMQMVMADKKRSLESLNALKLAEKELPKIPEAHPTTVIQIDSELPLAERAKQEWNQSTALRKEFSDDFDAFVAYKEATEKGLVRILSNSRK